MKNQKPSLQEGDRVKLITWAPLQAGVSAGFPAMVRFGQEGFIVFANNGLQFGGSHAVKWDNGTYSGAVRGCWLERIEKGREMKEEVRVPGVSVKDLAESRRRRELAERLNLAAQNLAAQEARAQRTYDQAVASAWEHYDAEQANG